MGYTPRWEGVRQTVEDVANQVAREFPDDWKIAHKRDANNNEVPGNDIYIRRVAHRLSQMPGFQDVGLNGKRGDVNNLSRDVLAFPHPGGVRDGSGKYLGLELRDIIVSAGTPQQHVGFGDVTPATVEGGAIGAWVEPKPVEGQPSQPSQPQKPTRGFPPRDAAVRLVNDLDEMYEERGRTPIELYVDLEGLGVWLGEFFRHYQAGKSVDEAIQLVKDEIKGIWKAEDERNSHD